MKGGGAWHGDENWGGMHWMVPKVGHELRMGAVPGHGQIERQRRGGWWSKSGITKRTDGSCWSDWDGKRGNAIGLLVVVIVPLRLLLLLRQLRIS